MILLILDKNSFLQDSGLSSKKRSFKVGIVSYFTHEVKLPTQGHTSKQA